MNKYYLYTGDLHNGNSVDFEFERIVKFLYDGKYIANFDELTDPSIPLLNSGYLVKCKNTEWLLAESLKGTIVGTFENDISEFNRGVSYSLETGKFISLSELRIYHTLESLRSRHHGK